ncbi:MAG: GTP 3',8-cyclase MoaA [Candidatus Bathyarchaeales archaeon]
MVLRDSWGRPLLNLRIAVTHLCNLNCPYCHKEGETSPFDAGEMSAEEIARIVGIAVRLGVSKVKITGGEPLIRRDITGIVQKIAKTPGLAELSMTTNGTRLAGLAKELHESGLKRVNISLPTLDENVYSALTGGRLEDALEGAKAAVNAGFNPVKINMLILKGVNDGSVLEMMDFAGKMGAVLQLIELEPLNVDMAYYNAHHKVLDEYEAMLQRKAVRTETRRYMQSRRVYHLPQVTVEVVHPIENTSFCANCTRLRLTSDGKLKPCLMRNDNLVDILTPMRNGATDEELMEIFKHANQLRQPYNQIKAQ